VAEGALMGWFTDGLGYLFDADNWSGSGGLWQRLVEHVWLTLISVLVACLIAIPIGLWLGHVGRGGGLAINVGNVGRAIPTFAVIVLLYLAPAPFGVTTLSLVVALVLFCLPPLLTNTYVGMREVDRDTVEAANGMGMSGTQVLSRVEVPLAAGLILNGVRLAAVQGVATAAIAGTVGGGGLGRVITFGFRTQDRAVLVAGALLVTILALILEVSLAYVQRRVDVNRRAERAAKRVRMAPRIVAATSA